jgi:hypothetical protein
MYDTMTPLGQFFKCSVEVAFYASINTIESIINPDPNLELKIQTNIGFKNEQQSTFLSFI